MQNLKLSDFQRSIRGRKVAVLGAGISNRPLIRWLYPQGCEITVFDRQAEQTADMQELKAEFAAAGINVAWSLGEHYLTALKGFAVIFRTPNMRPDLPEIEAERVRGAQITSEMSLFLELCPAPVTGITGSDGKTTTTTLIGEMYKAAGFKVYVGGNIGAPLLSYIEEITAEDRVVVELSSFQLMDMRPALETAVITNVTPNHLDFHADYTEYLAAKKRIYQYQPDNARLILNAEDVQFAEMKAEAKAEIGVFNQEPAAASACQTCAWLEGEIVKLRHKGSETDVLSRSEVHLPGRFNVDNIMAAVLATAPEVAPAIQAEVVRDFRGVRHRLQWIRQLDGADWYNSSIDSSPTRSCNTLAAVREQGREMVLIAGGKDKNCDYTALGAAILATTSRIILCGANASLIEDALRAACSAQGRDFGALRILKFSQQDNTAAYTAAIAAARSLARQGDAVVFSPAGTGFDRFRNFAERGEFFCELVLAQAEPSQSRELSQNACHSV